MSSSIQSGSSRRSRRCAERSHWRNSRSRSSAIPYRSMLASRSPPSILPILPVCPCSRDSFPASTADPRSNAVSSAGRRSSFATDLLKVVLSLNRSDHPIGPAPFRSSLPNLSRSLRGSTILRVGHGSIRIARSDHRRRPRHRAQRTLVRVPGRDRRKRERERESPTRLSELSCSHFLEDRSRAQYRASSTMHRCTRGEYARVRADRSGCG